MAQSLHLVLTIVHSATHSMARTYIHIHMKGVNRHAGWDKTLGINGCRHAPTPDTLIRVRLAVTLTNELAWPQEVIKAPSRSRKAPSKRVPSSSDRVFPYPHTSKVYPCKGACCPCSSQPAAAACKCLSGSESNAVDSMHIASWLT